MEVEKTYLGTWFPRTALHLREIQEFITAGSVVAGLDQGRAQQLRAEIQITQATLRSEQEFDYIEATGGGISITITEDGVVLLEVDGEDPVAAKKQLTDYYERAVAPLLKFLFSRGAPLPKDLVNIGEVHPVIILVSDAKEGAVTRLLHDFGDAARISITHHDPKLYFGAEHLIVSSGKGAHESGATINLIRSLVFIREFEYQLKEYVAFHRTIWDQVSNIRRSHNLRYKDFTYVRQQLLHFLETLSFVKARIGQMGNIAKVRAKRTPQETLDLLEHLSSERFEHLESMRKYVSELWDMTGEYVSETMTLLESLYEENAQRELGLLKFITFMTFLTGFFGMNIAFPWEPRWPTIYSSSIWVLILMIIISVGIYYLLKAAIENRRFRLSKKK